MILSDLAKRASKFATDNSPTILTGIAVAGTVMTAYLAGKASYKAADVIEGERLMALPEKLEFKDKVRAVWTLYIPAVGTGLLTVTCIIGANRIGARREAAMAAAYVLGEKAFDEYRKKVVEKIGDKKEELIRAEVVQDRVNANPPNQLLIAGSGSVLCYEAFTGRYFISDVEALRKAENVINHRLIHDNYVSLSDFYDEVGLAHTSVSDDLGWNLDKMLELHFTAVLTELDKPCVSIEFTAVPIRGYHRVQ